MKAIGIIRRVDELGRIVIPKEIRVQTNINDKDPIQILVMDDGSIILTPCKRKCICCGNSEEDLLKTVNEVHLCPECLEKFGGEKI